MKLELTRGKSTNKSTPGALYVDSVFECFTLEDVEREVKIKGETAIPKGEYKVIINMSNRFKKMLPLLIDVPNFEGVRIHSGNTSADTEGCILVGESHGPDFVGNSRLAFNKLFAKMNDALVLGEEITIEIK